MMTIWLMFCVIFVVFQTEVNALDNKVNITKFEFTPGLHFHQLGNVRLYNKEWKIITYLDYSEFREKYSFLKSYRKKTAAACDMMKNQTYSCRLFHQTSNVTLDRIETELSHIENILGHSQPRIVKRGWFDIIGKGAKVLFGTLDSDDATYYNDVIKNVNENEQSITKLVKDQVNVVKSTLITLNSTVATISHNEKILFENLNKISDAVRTQGLKFNVASYSIDMDEHITLFNLYTNQFQFEILTLLNAILDARQGLIHPAIISPNQIIAELQKSINHFPTGLESPIPLNADYAHLLLNIIKPICYFESGKLVFLIQVPLLEATIFNLIEINPLPTKINKDKFAFISPSVNFLVIDDSKQQYLKFSKNDLSQCIKPTEDKFICKQEQPIIFAHIEPICEVIVYQQSKSIPSTCEKHITQLEKTVYLHLKDTNSWLYAAPASELLTIHCKNSEPENINLKGTGCISLGGECKAFAQNTVLIPHSQTSNGKPIPITSFLPEFNLKMDCCEDDNLKRKLNETNLKLDTSLRPYTQYIEGMNIASHKLDDIRKAAEEEESILRKHLINSSSTLAYIIAAIALLYAAYRTIKWMRNKSCCGLGSICIRVEQNVHRGYSEAPTVVTYAAPSMSDSMEMDRLTQPPNREPSPFPGPSVRRSYRTPSKDGKVF